VASKEHKMRIEVGYGLEGELPDIVAGRIVRDVMAPHFKRGEYDAGVSAAVTAIIDKTGGGVAPAVSDPQKVAHKKQAGPVGRLLSGLFKLAFFGIFALVLLFVLFLNLFIPRRRYFGGYFGGGGGFGGGFGGGGGGFSGGGGSFGGGGASGDW
jgi:uncharacterized protein